MKVHRSPQTLDRIPLPEAASLLFVSPNAATTMYASPTHTTNNNFRTPKSSKRDNSASGAVAASPPTRRNLERDVVQQANFEQVVWARLEALEDMVLQLGLQVKQIQQQQEQHKARPRSLSPLQSGSGGVSPRTEKTHHRSSLQQQSLSPPARHQSPQPNDTLALSVSSNSSLLAPPEVLTMATQQIRDGVYDVQSMLLQYHQHQHLQQHEEGGQSPFSKKPSLRLLADRSESPISGGKSQRSTSPMWPLPSYYSAADLVHPHHASSDESMTRKQQQRKGELHTEQQIVMSIEEARTPTRQRPHREISIPPSPSDSSVVTGGKGSDNNRRSPSRAGSGNGGGEGRSEEGSTRPLTLNKLSPTSSSSSSAAAAAPNNNNNSSNSNYEKPTQLKKYWNW